MKRILFRMRTIEGSGKRRYREEESWTLEQVKNLLGMNYLSRRIAELEERVRELEDGSN
jgi:hypothetical protein